MQIFSLNLEKGGDMSDKLKELLEKPSLYDVIALFVKYCTDDTSRIKVRERAIMYLLYDEWGNFGEKAPAGLKDLLKDVAFSRSPCWFSPPQNDDTVGELV